MKNSSCIAEYKFYFTFNYTFNHSQGYILFTNHKIKSRPYEHRVTSSRPLWPPKSGFNHNEKFHCIIQYSRALRSLVLRTNIIRDLRLILMVQSLWCCDLNYRHFSKSAVAGFVLRDGLGNCSIVIRNVTWKLYKDKCHLYN